MLEYSPIDNGCEIRCAHEVLRIEQWGCDSVRVRAAQHRIPADDVGALEPRPQARRGVPGIPYGSGRHGDGTWARRVVGSSRCFGGARGPGPGPRRRGVVIHGLSMASRLDSQP